MLARDGHNVILEKIEDWNVVELMVNEEVVFHCNIKDLEFGKSFGTALLPSSILPSLKWARFLVEVASGLGPDSNWTFFLSLKFLLKALCT